MHFKFWSKIDLRSKLLTRDRYSVFFKNINCNLYERIEFWEIHIGVLLHTPRPENNYRLIWSIQILQSCL